MNIARLKIFAGYCLLLLFLCLSCHSQSLPFQFSSFQKITTEQGLSSNMVWSMMQDRRGFIWFATAYGLNRYDGYRFKTYNYNAADSNTFSSGWFYSMIEDGKGVIWIADANDGFYSFNPATEKFIHYRHQKGNANSLSTDLIQNGNFVRDSNGIIWLSTSDGLNAFDPDLKHFEIFKHHDNDSTSLHSNSLSYMCVDEENNLWIVNSGNCIDYFNTKTKKVMAHFRAGLAGLSGSKNSLHLVVPAISRNGTIWIGTENNGFYGFNLHSKDWKHFMSKNGNPNSPASNNINWIDEDHKGNLLILYSQGSMDHYSPFADKFYHFDFKNVNNGSDFKGTSFLEDRSGKIWIVSENGIISCEPSIKTFHNVRREHQQEHPAGTNNFFPSDAVTSFSRTTKGIFFVGTANGVVLFDEKSGRITPFELRDSGGNIFGGNIVWQIRDDANGNLWFCTNAGLVFYNPVTGDHHLYQHDGRDSTSLSDPSATDILEDNKGRYWISTFGGGLDLFDPGKHRFRVFKVNEQRNSTGSNTIFLILKSSKGLFYLGSQNGGLIEFDPRNETFKGYQHNPADPTSISCNITIPLFEEKSGIIWIGTHCGGINAFDPVTGKFRAFTMADGLPSNGISAAIKDDNGRTWLGTNAGISSCVLPEDPFNKNVHVQFRNYDVSDGLPSNDVLYLAAAKMPSGNLYFNTSNAGFFYFNPKELYDNAFVPPVYITDFKLFNKSVGVNDTTRLLSSTIETTKKIILKYDQNQISFSFAALNFIHPEKNQYAYKLERFNKDWVYTDASNRIAYYTNLDPGEYTFKVKGSNNDGVWNETPATIRLIITPPFWKTWWFRILILMAIAGLIYGIYRYRLQEVIRLQNIRNKIAGDLHDDIGSTLNSISIFSQVAEQDSAEQKHALQMIGESSRKVMEGMSDIVWTINPENDSFEKIIFRMRSLTYNLLHSKNIEFTFRADATLNEKKLSIEERRNFYLIFKEALNNTVKYAGATLVMVHLKEEHSCVHLIVRDNGKGFDASQIPPGNGLNNMKRRAKEMRAELKIESSPGSGTGIELKLKA